MTRRNKYGAKPRIVAGVRIASGREAKRWSDLQWMEMDLKIEKLERQVTYILAPSVKIAGEKRARPALRYTADFRYVENGKVVVEDAKGRQTEAFRIKSHLMKSVHNIDVRLS